MVEQPQVISEVARESFNIVKFFDTYINVITGGSVILGGIIAILNRKWISRKTKNVFKPKDKAGVSRSGFVIKDVAEK
jgi:hypothetical protein